ncbi:hypothetical protein IWW37_005736 [Coemansia sp. RSA 2050]|nr:hypothetical protein IWW37_005736 [Coemansia sp. RSA 2050]KAJ2733479.1 hypothetical protein IW152_003030 [Coemansia sp. BCRC 34962]
MESAILEVGRRRVVMECPAGISSLHSIGRIQAFPPLRAWLQKLDQGIEVSKLTIQSVDAFRGGRIGFVKLSSDARCSGARIPGIVFLRGPSAAVLLMLRLGGSDGDKRRVPSYLDSGYAVMVEQARAAVGEAALLELPAGMDDGGGVCTAVREVMEETGVAIEAKALVELGGGVYPSPGACDETMRLYACEKVVTSDELARVKDRLGGCRAEGEAITVRLVRICDLWQRTLDMKAMAALYLWDRHTQAQM